MTTIYVARATVAGTPYAFFATTDEAFDAPDRDALLATFGSAFPDDTPVLATESGRFYCPGHLRDLYPVTIRGLDFVKYDASELFSEPTS